MSLFTAGAYDSVRLDEQGQLQILTEGREVRPELLSRGTLAQTLQTLSTLQNQIFLFTCQKREVEMLKKMKLDYNLIEMEAYH